MPRRVLEFVQRTRVFGLRVTGEQLVSDQHRPIAIGPSFTDPSAKLGELYASRLEAAVISLNPPLFGNSVSPDWGEQLCQIANEGLADFCTADPTRLHWMAHVPLQAPERAVAVLRSAAADGCVGVEICSLAGGRRPDAEEFDPFWATADDLGLPVFIHPGESNPGYPGMQDYFLQNVIGNLLETTIVIERLICSGLLDRYPGLRVLLPHGGGFFPFQAGRLRHAQTVRPELESRGRDPWSYRPQIFVDTLTHDTTALRYVAERMGPSSVVLGTDLPTAMAATNIVSTLEEAFGTDSARSIAEENGARLFRLV